MSNGRVATAWHQFPQPVGDPVVNVALSTRRSASPMEPLQSDVTLLLKRLSEGDKGALNQLVPLVYGELRRLASSYMRHERPDHTLQTTALVHEAYLQLVDQTRAHWENRGQFFGVAAQ